jgi:hypothetical protein
VEPEPDVVVDEDEPVEVVFEEMLLLDEERLSVR